MQHGLSISILTDPEGRYYSEFQYDDNPVSSHVDGELDLLVENEDRSIRMAFSGWKADEYLQVKDAHVLRGEVDCGLLCTRIYLELTYSSVNDHVVRRTFRIRQSNIPLLFFQISETLSPFMEPARCWSFDNPDHKGGWIHGTYPAAGFLTREGIAVGLLTDAGHRNLWTQNVRRRPNPGMNGFTALREMSDARLFSLADGKISLSFGCLSDFSRGENSLLAPFPPSTWLMLNESVLEEGIDGPFTVHGEPQPGGNGNGVFIPYALPDGTYTLSFSYRSDGPVSLRILKETPEGEVRAFHYQDNLPQSREDWHPFQDSFFLSDTERNPSLVKIWQSTSETHSTLQIRDLRMEHHKGEERPYHRLCMGHPETRATFLFAETAGTIRELRLASQLRLAEGLGFSGTDPEKVLFADMQMLTWITSHQDFTPLNVPSINYAPDMYNRDSFWSICGVNDKALSLQVFNRWGDTQTSDGCIGTIVTPFMGSMERKGNEATCEWLWWALINQKKYNLTPPGDKIALAFDYCVREFDSEHSGICKSHYVLGQNDVTNYQGERKTSDLSVNQGVWAVTLQAARDLGLPVTPGQIERAIAGYLAFYQEPLGYLVNDRLHPYAISTGDLMPEFVSLWLWDTPMLSDAAVIGTLDHIPLTGDCAHFMGHAANRYFTREDIPCDPGYFWPNGIYYHGGSWMREEILAYVCGMKHGWFAAGERIRKRLEAEINLNEDEPFSHEFLPTDPTVPGCWWPSARVFSWNVFALTALEVAGMR